MGKVTIIIESPELSNDNLEHIVRDITYGASEIIDKIYEDFQLRADVKIYIVPGDEE